MTTSGPADLNIAHQGSGHVAPGPPSPSGGPAPTPSGQWVPAPYMYISRSRTLHASTGSGARTEFGGNRGCVLDSYMDIDQPANLPAQPGEHQPTGADLSNQAIIGVAQIANATGKAYSDHKKFAVTGNAVKLCVPGENQGSIHLANGVLVDAGAPGMTFAQMNQFAARVTQSGDPVNVVSGEVIDTRSDLYLPGKIDFELLRLLGSDRHRERSPFGRGGFTHNYHQWIEIDASKQRTVLRGEDGRELALPLVEPRSSTFHRGRQLTVSRAMDGWTVFDHTTRLFRDFAPLEERGRAMLRAVRDAWSNTIQLDYAEGRLSRILETARREVRFGYDREGRIVRIEVWAPQAFVDGRPERYQLAQHVDYAYTADGELASATDALGHSERYAYDGRHRIVEKTLKNGTRFAYLWDADLVRCVQSGANGGLQKIELFYDARKRSTKVHGTPAPREYIHDDNRLVVLERTFDGSVEEATEFDQDQLVVMQRNAGGEATRYERNERGQVVKAIRADGSEIRWKWQDDLLIERTDPGERVSRLEYDGRGALTRWSQPSGRWHSYSVDEHGRIAAVHDVAGVVVAFGFDEQHNVIRETDARGAVTSYAYDPMGRMVGKTDALGRSFAYAYDALGRLVRERRPDGTTLFYDWDAMGNVVATSDGRAADAAQYAGTGAIARRTLPDGTSWEYTHDVLERLREVKNARGEVHRFRWDAANRVVEERTFDGELYRYRYSPSNVLSRIDYMDDTYREFEYDALGQRVAETNPHASLQYERNEVGWIVRAVVSEYFGDVVTEVAYNPDGQVTKRTVDGRTIEYEYTETGFRAARKLPNGQVTRYYYDPGGSLIGVDHGGQKVLLQRDALGREVRRHIYSAGVDMVFGWSDDDRLAALKVSAGKNGAAEVLVDRSWQYGAHARVAATTDLRWGTREHFHDARGRLIGMRRGGKHERYLYDAAGYLEGVDRDGDEAATSRWTLREGNLLLRTHAGHFEYDDRRRRRGKVHLDRGTPTGAVTEYLWDCRDQLREVRLPDGVQVHFAYDAFGHLVRKAIVSPPDPEAPPLAPPKMRFVEYVWDGDELAMLIDSEEGETVFVHEPRSFFPILERRGDESLWYVTDPLGVPTELIDDRGRVAVAFSHSPWGKRDRLWRQPARAEHDETPFRLLGQVFHPEVGLASTLYRWFDADTARWLSPDPAGLAGGPDRFGFDGSPTERVDLLGLYTAASFQQFLNDTNQPRINANNAALAAQRGGNPNGPNCLGPATAAASCPVRPGQPGPAVATNAGGGPEGHAERNPLRSAQGLPPSTTDSGVGAVGAGRPHCGGCTASIINTPGAVPSSRIRGAATDRDGNPRGNNGFEIPPPSGPPGFLP